jgi:hypothetical protein
MEIENGIVGCLVKMKSSNKYLKTNSIVCELKDPKKFGLNYIMKRE